METTQRSPVLSPHMRSPIMDTHPMKRQLDAGALNTRKRDREFTVFLDLDNKFHNEFLTRLQEHVKLNGYCWEDMLELKNELRTCARSFVKKYGREYWGTEENRKKYFLPEAFKTPECLTEYPARREEITRVVMMLLEKKASNITKGKSCKKPKQVSAVDFTKETETPSTDHAKSKPTLGTFLIPSPVPPKRPQSPSYTLYDGSSPSIPLYREANDRQAKRKYDMFETPSPESARASFHANEQLMGSGKKEIKPFCSVTSLVDPPKKPTFESCNNQNKTAAPVSCDEGMQDNPIALTTPIKEEPQSNFGDTPLNKESNNDRDHDHDHHFLPRLYYPEKQTTFLVSATSQPDMGPVWVPFREFGSASSFLSYMAGECHSEDHYYWDANMQLNNEITFSVRSPSSSFPPPGAMAVIAAATVKFEWNNFVIRVRRGRDQDWAVVMRELQKSWAASSSLAQVKSTPESDGMGVEHGRGRGRGRGREEGFKISVKLHIVGNGN